MPVYFDNLPPQRAPNLERSNVLVKRFNSEVKIGHRIRYWIGRRGDGDGVEAKVSAPGAFILGGSAVVKIEGNSIALTHVEVL